MPWTETAPGHFYRPLGENEAFIKLVSDPGHVLKREHWAVNFTATIRPLGALADSYRTEALPALIRRAWIHLRFCHPSLAAEPDESNTALIYNVPSSPQDLQNWALQTFTTVPAAVSANEVIATLPPHPHATLYFIPRSGELLGHTAHWRTDGIGSMMLLDALLKLLAQPDLSDDPFSALPWGSETERLAPSVEEAASIPAVVSSAQKAEADNALASFSLAAGAVGIPYNGDKMSVPAGTHSARTIFSVPATAAVVEATKARGLTVTAAVHASIAGAHFRLASPENRGRHYASTIRVDLRPYLSEPYSTPAYAAGLYTTGWMVKVNSDIDWNGRAKLYHEGYCRGLSADYLAGHREYVNQLCTLIRNLPQGGEPPSDVDISCIDVAENLLSRTYGTESYGLEVHQVSIGTEILTRQGVCFVWTFRDQLNLSVVYNEAFHGSQQMQQFLETVKYILLKELGVTE